jgi:hypothetical protein
MARNLWFSFGKVVFAAGDIVAGWLILLVYVRPCVCHGEGVEIRKYMVAEPHGCDNQYEGKFGGLAGRRGDGTSMGGHATADKDRWCY